MLFVADPNVLSEEEEEEFVRNVWVVSCFIEAAFKHDFSPVRLWSTDNCTPLDHARRFLTGWNQPAVYRRR